ncbi:excisionase [Rhodococcus sp. NPDC127530]|uniref:excisionase n=1 Tax=unclassified Rhodococcus (in: high G+C Gram-positive bacteria) TaxID=192944 RepID=UPI0036423038
MLRSPASSASIRAWSRIAIFCPASCKRRTCVCFSVIAGCPESSVHVPITSTLVRRVTVFFT